MRFDYIECGDSLALLKSLPNESIDCIITSPPYFNLRDYEADGQIGNESSPKEYIEKLMMVFNEAYRVLKKNGSLWLNIDDVYAQKNIDGVKRQSLMCIPDRLKIMMIESGWICRNEIIWRKPNAMPSSAKNRFNNDYEKFYFFVKSNEYTFNTQYEPMKTSVAKNTTAHKRNSKYKNDEQEKNVRQGMSRTRGLNIVAIRKNLPTQAEFVDFLRSRCTVDGLSRCSNIKKSTIEHWFRRDKIGFSFPTVEDWNKIKFLIDDWSEDFRKIDEKLNDITYETDDILKNSNKGRLKRAVWDINTKAFKGHHFASYPAELIKFPILACTHEGDVVLDPFIGSGTTGYMAKKLNRHYIGFDLNSEYCKIAKLRIEEAEVIT